MTLSSQEDVATVLDMVESASVNVDKERSRGIVYETEEFCLLFLNINLYKYSR